MISRVIEWWTVNIPPWVLIALIAHGVVMLTVAYLILLERKVASWVQDRLGPNRVGLGFGIIPIIKNWKMNGLGQPLADGLKFIVKEDYRPAGVDKILFTVAPGLMILVIVVSIAVLPWGGIRQTQRVVTVPAHTQFVTEAVQNQLAQGDQIVGNPVRIGHTDQYQVTYEYPFQIASLNIGVLFILAVLSLSVYGVVIGGWASNNKYSFLGGLRATANMISYEIPLGLAVLCIVVMYGTLDLNLLVEKQCHDWVRFIPAWNVFTQPLAFIMFLICIHAEANRAPFDVAEAEQELVGGYHTEYSAMRFALFFLGEYAGMITTSAVCVALFFGGWDFPGLRGPVGHPALSTSLIICILRAVVFYIKTLIIIFVFMWVRWTLPRFRFDQIMMLAWRALIPVSLALLMMTTVIVYVYHGNSYELLGGSMALTLLIANAVVAALVLIVSTMIPPAPATNRRLTVLGSRFNKTPLPAASPSLSN
ncbi:MAG TPA: complex I subunit 1 family protein [Tepidisphaeraceae bacterium]|jgi:NADH-quinone oxidoreductase subunit H|nr:complex I subunit 1 family protein [Tepidisphaeraceae bacterium]